MRRKLVGSILLVLGLALSEVCQATMEYEKCCDIENADVTGSAHYFGQKIDRFMANASNTAKCPSLMQCVPCELDDFNMERIFDRCSDCKNAGGGVCMPCLLGSHCPEGSVNKLATIYNNLCPDGQVCTPELQGFSSSGWTWGYSVSECKEGYTCAAGTALVTEELQCQKIIVDWLREQPMSSRIEDSDPSGYYCKNGSSPYDVLRRDKTLQIQECARGHYCPNASMELPCPAGSYCKSLAAEPVECPGLGDQCTGEGNKQPSPAIFRILLVLLVYLVLLVLGSFAQIRMRNAAQKEREKTLSAGRVKSAKNELAKQILAGMNIDTSRPQCFASTGFTPVTISFENLGLSVAGKKVLSNVSGKFEHSHLIAVMGPSGCGKSTLLNTLCGRANYGVSEGCIKINDVVRPVSKLKSVMGFVPQDDTVYGDLTVIENFQYSAELRAPQSYTSERKKDIVHGLCNILGLTHIQDSVVGTVEKRGISGGQKKRVNIGVEMCSDPTVLFMDEPTSGLASTDTLTIIRGLHSFARAKRTIIAVIHQPRYLAFILFHDVMLLYPGGYTVFFGQASTVQDYFECLGFTVPKVENPADFFLDVISDRVPKNVKPGEKKFTAFDLCTLWTGTVEPKFHGDVSTFIDAARAKSLNSMSEVKRQHSKKKVSSNPKEVYKNPLLQLAHRKIEQGYHELDSDKTGTVSIQEMRDYMVNVLQVDLKVAAEVTKSLDENKDGELSKSEYFKLFREELHALDEEAEDDREATEELEFKPRVTVNVLRQFFILLKRTLVQKIRLYDAFMMNLSMMMVCGLLVGILLGSDFQPYKPEDTKLTLMMALIMAILVTLSAVNSLQLFGYERVMIAREKSSGVSIVAFFLAKCIIDVLENFWQPLFFLGFSYNFILPMTDFLTFYASLIFVSFAASGVGILFGVIIQPATMTLATVLFSLVVGIFLNGTIGLLYANVKSTGGVMLGLWSISFSRWAQELLVVGELEASKKFAYQDYLVQSSVLYYGYFPPFETKNKWEEGKTSEEKSQDWEDYFDSYGDICRMNLVLIGLGLRLIALLCLRFWEEITSLHGKVARWISDTIKEVYGFSKDIVEDVLEEVGIIEDNEERQRRRSVERTSLGSAGSNKPGPVASSNKVQPDLDEVKVITPSDRAVQESR